MRPPLHRLRPFSLLLAFSIGALACSESVRCEAGLCPIGMVCDGDTGRCVDAPAAADATPRLSGRYALLGLGADRHAIVGYSPARRSVAYIEHAGDEVSVSFVAGEATDDGLPAGDVVDAVADEAGVVHVAWVRRSDGSLWYGRREGGTWLRERVTAIAPHRPGDRLALALWNGVPTVAFDEIGTGRLFSTARANDGTWTAEEVPLPPDVDGKVARVGGTLVASAQAGSLTLAFYEPGGGDLVIATRTAAWVASRLVGRAADGTTDAGDAGRPCALARDTKGGLVVAYRDRSANSVRLLRSAAGAAADSLVDDGAYTDALTGVVRRDLVGTALDVVRMAGGGLAVAWQDASLARLRLAVEASNGQLQEVDLPATNRPQLRPRLLAQADGSLLLAWLELDGEQPGGRVAELRWTPLGGAE